MDVINLYTCGPTVYTYSHIGNLRAYIAADLKNRALKYLGQKVNWVMNITDVDDKTIKGTIDKFGPEATVANLKEYSRVFTNAFVSDLQKLNVDTSDLRFINVTDVIADIQQFIVDLIDKGYAYKAKDGSTYFSIEKYQADFSDYGTLVGPKFLEGKKMGARVKVDEYDKENLSDFVLWKAPDASEGKIFWDHPVLGPGRPGWHIECSAINRLAFGGETTDIHTGGVDLIFPHHTNEIAQSQPLYKPFVKEWLHSEHLLVDGKKMSKSLGNIHTLADLEAKNISPLAYRYFLLTANYRSSLNLTDEALEGAKTAYEKLVDFIREIPEGGAVSEQYLTEFKNYIDSDLDTPKALALVWKLVKDSGLTPADRKATLLNFDRVLGLVLEAAEPLEIPPEVQTLVEAREKARQAQNWAESDALRDQIRSLGYDIKDTDQGPRLTKS